MNKFEQPDLRENLSQKGRMNVSKALILTFSLIGLASCSSIQEMPSGTDLHIITTPNEIWQIENVSIKTLFDEVYISGKLIPSTWAGAPRGHIDLAAYSHSGDLLFEKAIPWKRSKKLIRRRLGPGGQIRFSVKLDEPLPEKATIAIVFHRGERWPAKQLDHKNKAAF